MSRFFLLPLLLFVLLGGVLGAALFRAPAPETTGPPTLPDFRLPPIEGLDAPGLETGDLRQGRLSIVNVWASWCGPCRAEMPVLARLGEEDILLTGIAYKDAPENSRRFLARFGNPFAHIGDDPNGVAALGLGVLGVPETFLVNGEGRIILRHFGPLTEAHLSEIFLPALRDARREANPR